MQFIWQTVTYFEQDAPLLRRARYGIIETSGGELTAIHLRPWPKLISLPECWPTGPRFHGGGPVDCCWLYYNQPRQMPEFLALRYMVSTAGTTFATFRAALAALDQVASLKKADAAICDAGNLRLSARLMRRFGWEAHKPQRWHRNYIRRYYGNYPLANKSLNAP